MNNLFDRSCIFISDKLDKQDILKDVYHVLLEKDLVTKDFYEKLLERENNYPTGLDLSPIDPNLINIAIPHTETEYVKTTKIIPIKLKNPVNFKDMINPSNIIPVSYLFMILNNQAESQCNLLAQIMDFINSTDTHELKVFFDLEDKDKIYTFLKQNFKGED